MIRWWERKRLVYNILVIGLSTILIYSYWDYPMRSIIGGPRIIGNTIFFIVGANLFYTLGWGLEVMRHYLFKTNSASKTIRWVLFVLGTIFSLIWTSIYHTLQFDVLFAY